MASRMSRIARRWLIILGILVVVFLLGVVPWFFAHIVTRGSFHYPDPNDGKSPVSYNLQGRWIEFKSTDGVTLKGWYVPAEGTVRGTIIYCHGLNRTRIEMLPRAQFGHQLGYNALLLDFRHQGQSGGDLTTLGYRERFDVLGAARYAQAEEKAARPIIVWGVSMGAAAGLMAAADSPEIAAVISDSSFLSLSDTVIHHLKLFLHLPAFPIAYEVIYLAAWRGGFPASGLDLGQAVERIGNRPILFIGVTGDRRMPPAVAEALYSHAKSPASRVLILPGNRHGEGFNQAREQYEKAVTDFLANLHE